MNVHTRAEYEDYGILDKGDKTGYDRCAVDCNEQDKTNCLE
ncbi:hypothetical protein [Acidithiobacillus thiooxidans]|nr:hypothetical protein [Acidithiobacillus thiooxidans]